MLCALLLVVVTVACLQVLAAHDIARTAARAATVADDPCIAAERAAGARASLRCTLDESRGTVTVAVRPRVRIPGFGGVVARITDRMAPWTSVTMMREPPPVLG